MNFLNNKIPPPVVGLTIALCMYGLIDFGPKLAMGDTLKIILTLLFAIVALALELPAVVEFWKQKTTVNPVKIEQAKHLVVSGAFKFTRNPMYLGMSFLLVAWAIHLTTALAFFGPIVFVLYITKFQILPEERALSQIFGAQYKEYQEKVRRWL